MAKGIELEVPFQGGVPITETRMREIQGGRADELKRVDGPVPAGSANTSNGGRSRFKSEADTRSDIELLEAVVESPDAWEMVEDAEARHSTPDRPGPDRGYTLMDVLVEEVAVNLHISREHTRRNLADWRYWEPLRLAAARAFPNDPSRRLSPTLPSRSQSYRARTNILSGETLDEFMKSLRRANLEAAVECECLDPDAGTWTRPARSQFVVGDTTWMPAATRWHRDKPRDPATGKHRRHDPDADYHHTRNGEPVEVPGRQLGMLTTHGDNPNVRFALDADFMRNKDDPDRITETDLAVKMLRRLLTENPDLTRGIKGFGYDMALSSKGIDDVIGLHVVPVVKVPKLAHGKYRNNTLGLHRFITLTGTEEYIDVKTLNGAPWIWLPEGHNKLQAVPLQRRKLQWGTEPKHKEHMLLYMHVAIPNDHDIPEPLRGATTMIRMNSTDVEINNKPNHTRRTRSLRPIPESDPHFAEVFGAREDVESNFSNLKYLTRGKLRSTRDDHNRFAVAAYIILRMTRSRALYYKNLAANAAAAVPIAA